MSDSESPANSELVAEIENQVEEWSTNSNDALRISLYRGDKPSEEFNPTFTYPIFGEEEVVFGYRGLDMSLSFAAHNLKPHMTISWKKKFTQLGDIKASDIRGALEDFVPESAFAEESASKALADPDAASFTPPGELVHSYKRGSDSFEIWKASVSDQRARELLENAQILVPLFIEGGTMLQLEDPEVASRWTLFLLYQVHEKEDEAPPFSLVGFSTSYRIFAYPDRREPTEKDLALLAHQDTDIDAIIKRWDTKSPNDSTQDLTSPVQLPSRERISQFLILPTHQGSGHGFELYNTMYTMLIAPDNVRELTVEDPNEAFDDLRDICDLIHLRRHNEAFGLMAINCNVEAEKLKPHAPTPVDDIVSGKLKAQVKDSSKIMPRQLARLIEMHTLGKIPRINRSTSRITRKENSLNAQDRAYYFWRLYVKQRLYVAHRDVLAQLDREERVEKLDLTVDNAQADYERLLDLAGQRMLVLMKNHGTPSSDKRKGRKRKSVVVDEEDEDKDEQGSQSSSKKMKKTK